MEQFYLITNPDREHVGEVARSVCSYPELKGCGYAIQGENLTEGSRLYKYTDASQIPERIECVITSRGDDTLIQAAGDLAGRQIPIIGINLGTFGYLAQISRQEDITQVLNDLIDGQYRMKCRMTLKDSVYRDGEKTHEGLALNETVLMRGEVPRILKFRTYVDGDYLNEYTADGTTVATPTGSTAYNLSASDSIVEPVMRMTALTPICPHALNMWSIVFPAEDRIEIEMTNSDDGGQVVVYDGDAVWGAKPGDRIEIEETEAETLLIKLKHISLLDNLRGKMTGVQLEGGRC